MWRKAIDVETRWTQEEQGEKGIEPIYVAEK